MTDRLVTRDGKVLKDIGSWEREQLKKIPEKEFIPKPHKNCKDSSLAYLYRQEDKRGDFVCWRVKIRINDLYYGTTSFSAKKYGGEEGSKKAATLYRDNKLEELRLKGIVAIDNRKKENK